MPKAEHDDHVYDAREAWGRSLIEAAKQHRLGNSWYCGFCDVRAVKQFMETDRPVCLYFNNDFLKGSQLRNDRLFAEEIDYLEGHVRNQFFTFPVAEWENWLWRWWDPVGQETMVEAAFGITAEQRARLDRRGFFDLVTRSYLDWKKQLRGHIASQNGYAMFSHLTAEVGSDFTGIETGENIAATQVKRAFARGAARQFGAPWWEDVSPWYGESLSVGRPSSPPRRPDGIYIGPHAGHSPSMLERLWYTSWFSGSACVCLEGALNLFDVPSDVKELPANLQLSLYGTRAKKLSALMQSEDIGIPYTPFGVLVSKYNGRFCVWGRPWGYLEKTVGDEMTERFFDQVFPGLSKGPGQEERYLCNSPLGDTFDVLVHGANREAWNAYPAILAVGDIPWQPEDIEHLKQYVKQGGILAFNEVNVSGWPRAYLGLAPAGFQPDGDAKVALASSEATPLLIRRKVGQGEVFVASWRPEPGKADEMAFPGAFLRSLAERFLPLEVEGNVEWMINRTPTGWAVLIANHQGFQKQPTEAPRIDPSKLARAGITFHAPKPHVTEVYAGSQVECRPTSDGENSLVILDVAPGEIRLLRIEM